MVDSQETRTQTLCETSRSSTVKYIQTTLFLLPVSPTRATNGGSVHASPARELSRDTPDYQYGRFDASALHIAHALKQTELQKAYHRPKEKPIDCYLVSLY